MKVTTLGMNLFKSGYPQSARTDAFRESYKNSYRLPATDRVRPAFCCRFLQTQGTAPGWAAGSIRSQKDCALCICELAFCLSEMNNDGSLPFYGSSFSCGFSRDARTPYGDRVRLTETWPADRPAFRAAEPGAGPDAGERRLDIKGHGRAPGRRRACCRCPAATASGDRAESGPARAPLP